MGTEPTKILSEGIDLSDIEVDREAFVIKGVKLLAEKSRNQGGRRRYSEQVIKNSVRLFEGMPVTIRGGHNRKERDYTCQNGQLRGGRYDEAGKCSRFDWHLNEADPLTPKILVDAVKFPQNVPLSSEATQWKQSVTKTGEILVQELTEDRTQLGVAVVYRGGVNSSLFEGNEDDAMEIKTKEELQAHYPALCEELIEGCACAAKTKEDELKERLEKVIAERQAVIEEKAKLESELSEFRSAAERTQRESEIRAKAKELVHESYEVDEDFMNDLLELYDEGRYERVLKKITPPASEGGSEGDDSPTSKSGAKASSPASSKRRLGRRDYY